MQVTVMGLGYVGCVTAACLAASGHSVTGVDESPEKVEAVRRGQAPVIEPGLDALIQSTTRAGRLRATTNADEAIPDSDVVMVCVGTPSRPNGSLDLTYVERVCIEIGQQIRVSPRRITVVIRSTTLPGTITNLVVPTLEVSSGRTAGKDFGVAMCPEFLREATAISDFQNPPFTIIGTDDELSAATVQAVFEFLSAPVEVVDTGTAEAIKYACNAFHAVKVTFANEMGRIASQHGIDARRVMEVFVRDTQLNISPRYLRPGFSFGGSCLPKDVRALTYLARSSDVSTPMLSALLTSNEEHTNHAVRAVLATGAKTVGVLGLTFKSGTDDLRESPYVSVVEQLVGKGVEVRIHDESLQLDALVGSNRMFALDRLPHLIKMLVRTPDEAVRGADCVVISQLDGAAADALSAAPPAHVLDLSGALPEALEARLRVEGRYEGAGW